MTKQEHDRQKSWVAQSLVADDGPFSRRTTYPIRRPRADVSGVPLAAAVARVYGERS